MKIPEGFELHKAILKQRAEIARTHALIATRDEEPSFNWTAVILAATGFAVALLTSGWLGWLVGQALGDFVDLPLLLT